jgi:hypothetical protein
MTKKKDSPPKYELSLTDAMWTGAMLIIGAVCFSALIVWMFTAIMCTGGAP